MSLVFIVAWREITTLLRRASFWIAALAAPTIAAIMLFGFGFVGREFGDGNSAGSSTSAFGYVDQANVIRAVPDRYRAQLIGYQDEAQAADALRTGHISSYFIVVPDYLRTGKVVRVSSQVSFTSSSSPDSRTFQSVLEANLAGDPQLAQRLATSPDLQVNVVGSPGSGTAVSAPESSGGVSYGLALLLAFSIANGGGLLLQAVAEEKENRTIEILLTSAPPWKFMTGKLLGLGTVVIVQFLAWLFVARILLRSPGMVQFNLGDVAPSLWIWIMLYFLLGFLMLGGMMLVLGTVGASMRESGQLSGLMTLPAVAPIWLSSAIVDSPDGTLARVLSIFPLTAPVTMMLRLGQGPVPGWELGLSLLLLALCVVGVVVLAARLFRGSTLLTGARPTPLAIWRALRST